jgi:hypothetical protein
MKITPELLALQQIHVLCQGHSEALQDALQDMELRALTQADYSHLSKEERRLLDQFAYRYTRLQDDMGARLMPATLKALGEDVAPMSAIDRFARLEQLAWLPSAEAWLALRHIRNQFAHDYPDSVPERFERLQAAAAAARQLLTVMELFNQRLRQHPWHIRHEQ